MLFCNSGCLNTAVGLSYLRLKSSFYANLYFLIACNTYMEIEENMFRNSLKMYSIKREKESIFLGEKT